MPAHLALTPAIDDFRRQFEQLADDADALVGTLRDEQFAWQPAPNAWSIAQCIDHLNVTARLYLPLLDEGIANAIRQGSYGEGPFTYWWLARMFVRMLEPPPRLRMKAPVSFNRPRPARAAKSWRRSAPTRCNTSIVSGSQRARPRARASPLRRRDWIRMPLGTGFAA